MQGQSKIALNNTGDEVWLISPDGNFKTGFKFPKIKSDKTFGFTQPILAYSASITPGGYWEKKDGLDGAEDNINKIGAQNGKIVGAQRAVPLQMHQWQNNVPLQMHQWQNNVPLQNKKNVSSPLEQLNIVDGGEIIIESDSSASKALEVSVIVFGVISSAGLLAVKVLRG